MNDPRNEPIPDDPVRRIQAFVRDLAYGALQGDWSTDILIVSEASIPSREHWRDAKAGPLIKLDEIWKDQYPYSGFLISFGYLFQIKEHIYRLTEKAFALLEQPSPASIFISYSRQESSAFALLILARLKALGLEPFLDMKDIKPGDEWHALLEDEIRERENFVCLVGPKTLESRFVCKEIEWALDAGVRTIPIWHNGFSDPEVASHNETLTGFLQRNAIIIRNEDAKSYEGAIIELLNYFGYTPS